MRRLVVWGAGALGGRVAQGWVEAGGEAIGFTLGESRHSALNAAGVDARVGEPIDTLRPDDALLLALPGTERQAIALSRLQDLTAPARLVVIGSVGYYGIQHGTVTEATAPGRELRSQKAAAMEASARRWCEHAVVLRMGGLYQPGRGPLSALKRRGAPLKAPPNTTLSLIHYADAARATLAALRHPRPRSTYTCVTPPSPTREAFYTAACVLLDLPLPKFKRPLKKTPARYDVSMMTSDLLPEAIHPNWQEALVP